MVGSVLDRPTRLRQWRMLQRLTLEEVSGLTGISVPMLSLVERGKRQFSRQAKVQVARGLEVPVAELFEAPIADQVEQEATA